MTIQRTSLILAIALLALGFFILGGRPETDSFPSVTSYEPSGLKALSILLEKEGYLPVQDRSPSPVLEKGDVAVLVNLGGFAFGQTTRLSTIIAAHLADGGTAISLNIPSPLPFLRDVKDEPETYLLSQTSQAYSTTYPSTKAFQPEGDPFYGDSEAPFSLMRREGDGVQFEILGGVVAVNRFLDQEENAEIILDHFRRAAPRGSRVVFLEASFGNGSEDSLFATLGNWAKAARTQGILLAVVIAWSLSRRFGAKAIERPVQRTARDMIDALAAVLRSGKRTRLALGVLLQLAEQRMRASFRAPQSIELDTLLSRCSPPLVHAYQEAKYLRDSKDKVSLKTALLTARQLDAEITQLEKGLASQSWKSRRPS